MSAINVNVRVQNNFTVTATSIIMTHQFSSNPIQTFAWTNIPAGGYTPWIVVQGSTSSGHDYWTMNITLTGNQVWTHTSQKTCTIESSDSGTYDTQVISPGSWTIPLYSGGCSTSLNSPQAAEVKGAKGGPGSSQTKPSK